MNGIPNLEVVEPGIYRGGQPCDAGWNWLKSAGITRVVKLNLESEATDVAAHALGMRQFYFPIDLDDQLIFKPKIETVVSATKEIVPSTFIHCSHGQDRTGLVVGCFRVWHQQWPKNSAWDEMIRNGFHPELLGLSMFWEWAV